MDISIKDIAFRRHRDYMKRQLLASVATIVKEEHKALRMELNVFDSVDVPSTSDDNDEIVGFEGGINRYMNAEAIQIVFRCILLSNTLLFLPFLLPYEQYLCNQDDVEISNAHAVGCVIDQILPNWSADTLPMHSGVVDTLVEDSCWLDQTVRVGLMVNIDDGFIDTGGFYFN